MLKPEYMKELPPCPKKCPERAWDCHPKCEKFMRWHEKHTAERQEYYAEKLKELAVVEILSERTWRENN